MDPLTFFKSLADDTRLQILLLTQQKGELCVCDFTEALQLSQPKISRHLAVLRKNGLLQDRREGQWVHYALHPLLPEWCCHVLAITGADNAPYIAEAMERLSAIQNCPQQNSACC